MADCPAEGLKYQEKCCPRCGLEKNFLPQQIKNFKTSSKGARMFSVISCFALFSLQTMKNERLLMVGTPAIILLFTERLGDRIYFVSSLYVIPGRPRSCKHLCMCLSWLSYILILILDVKKKKVTRGPA